MDETKNWWESSGVWGGIIAAASPVLGVLLHITILPADQGALAAAIAALASGIGGIVAVIGRVRATATIAPPKP